MTCISLQQNTTKRFFGYWPPKIRGPKTTYFQRLRNSMATEGQYLQQGRQLRNGTGNYEGSLQWSKFHELWSTNALCIHPGSHPPKSSSAWQWWPSCWPALWCANISSYVIFGCLTTYLFDRLLLRTLIYAHDLDISKMYQHSKNEASSQGFQKSEHK